MRTRQTETSKLENLSEFLRPTSKVEDPNELFLRHMSALLASVEEAIFTLTRQTRAPRANLHARSAFAAARQRIAAELAERTGEVSGDRPSAVSGAQVVDHSHRLGVEIKEVAVKHARERFASLITGAVERDEIYVIRNARRSASEGVVLMSETRARGETSRGGMSLHGLVEGFARRPVAVRSLKAREDFDDAEQLVVSKHGLAAR